MHTQTSGGRCSICKQTQVSCHRYIVRRNEGTRDRWDAREPRRRPGEGSDRMGGMGGMGGRRPGGMGGMGAWDQWDGGVSSLSPGFGIKHFKRRFPKLEHPNLKDRPGELTRAGAGKAPLNGLAQYRSITPPGPALPGVPARRAVRRLSPAHGTGPERPGHGHRTV
eukprot:452325-Hanusia_phi.AAC.1